MVRCPICGAAPYCEEVSPWDRQNGPPPWAAGCYQRSDPEHFVGANGDNKLDAVRKWNVDVLAGSGMCGKENETMWFKLKGDERITHRCASEGCGGQPTWKLEAEGVGSFYCSGCKEKIELSEENDRLIDENANLRQAMQEACDLLAGLTVGSQARSPGHNARMRLEGSLNRRWYRAR